MKTKAILIVILFLTNNNLVLGESLVLLNLNPFTGKNFSTKITDKEKVLSIFKKQLELKGYQVYTSSQELRSVDQGENDVFLIDIFPSQLRRSDSYMMIYIRKEGELVYYLRNRQPNTVQRQVAFEMIASKIAKEIPDAASIIGSEFEEPEKKHPGRSGKTIFGPVNLYKYQYDIKLQFSEETKLKYQYIESFEFYIRNYLLNYEGFRLKTFRKKIVLHLEIDEYGKTHLAKLDLPVKLNAKHKRKIEAIADGIPFWLNEEKKKVKLKLTIINTK